MSIDRAALTAFLNNEVGQLADVAKITATDTAAGFAPAIDQTFIMLGVPSDQLATGAVDSKYMIAAYALAKYFALKRITTAIARMVDVSSESPTVSRSLSQWYAQARSELNNAKADIDAMGFSLEVVNDSYGMGYIDLDFLWLDATDRDYVT